MSSARPDEEAEDLIAKIKKEVGRMFDPVIFKNALIPLEEFCAKGIIKTGLVEKELLVDHIEVGMTLARNVESGTGLVLLTKDMVLDEKSISSLKRYYALDPSQTGVFVWVER